MSTIDPALATAVLKHATESASPGAEFDPALPLDLIDFRRNARSELGDLAELTESVRANGVQQPISVIRNEGRFVLWLGHRRKEAAIRAGMATIPALIFTDITPDRFLAGQLVENLQRANMRERDIFPACLKLEDGGMSRAEIAKAIGKSAGTVTIYLSPKEAHPEVRAAFDAGDIKLGQVYKCNTSPTPLVTLAMFRKKKSGVEEDDQAGDNVSEEDTAAEPDPAEAGGKDKQVTVRVTLRDAKISITAKDLPLLRVAKLLAIAQKEAERGVEDGLTSKSFQSMMADRAKKPIGEPKPGKSKKAAAD